MLSLASFIIMRRHVTANEVYEFIKEAYPTIGKGTVYRNLDILVEEGALRKVEVPDGPNRFDFTLKNHYHVTVTKTEDLGSHTMFIGEITDMETLSNVPSVTYEYYQNNIKPKPREVGKTDDGQTIWRCRICGYEYVGEELPDDFICPICKHPASDFEKVVKKWR